jgi:hypothetical protein
MTVEPLIIKIEVDTSELDAILERCKEYEHVQTSVEKFNEAFQRLNEQMQGAPGALEALKSMLDKSES